MKKFYGKNKTAIWITSGVIVAGLIYYFGFYKKKKTDETASEETPTDQGSGGGGVGGYYDNTGAWVIPSITRVAIFHAPPQHLNITPHSIAHIRDIAPKPKTPLAPFAPVGGIGGIGGKIAPKIISQQANTGVHVSPTL